MQHVHLFLLVVCALGMGWGLGHAALEMQPWSTHPTDLVGASIRGQEKAKPLGWPCRPELLLEITLGLEQLATQSSCLIPTKY